MDCSEIPKVEVAVKVSPDLKVRLYRGNIEILDSVYLSSVLSPSGVLDRWSKLDSNLNHFSDQDEINDDDKLRHAVDILQQLCDDIVVVSFDDKHAFSLLFITEQLTLRFMPRKMSSKLDSDTNSHLAYLKNKAKHMDPHQRLVTLMIDEIHVEPITSFKAGNLQGFACNSPTQQATTVQAFMMASVLSKDRDIVSLIPVINMTAAYLKEITVTVLRAVHNAGFTVLSMISDNNRVNRNMFTMLCDSDLSHQFMYNAVIVFTFCHSINQLLFASDNVILYNVQSPMTSFTFLCHYHISLSR
jgi:hypothetical protein